LKFKQFLQSQQVPTLINCWRTCKTDTHPSAIGNILRNNLKAKKPLSQKENKTCIWDQLTFTSVTTMCESHLTLHFLTRSAMHTIISNPSHRILSPKGWNSPPNFRSNLLT
jgi:hypothetical protein